MAKFQYRMQNILDIKLKLESQAKIAYSQANAKYLEEDRILQDMMIRKMQYDEAWKEKMSGSMNVDEIRHARTDANNMKTLMRRQMVEVHKAQKQLEDAREQLNLVMQERKTQEILKEKAFEEFKAELEKQEAKEIDELVSFTYNAK